MGQTVLSRDTNLSKTFQGVRKSFLRKLIDDTWENNIVPMLLYPDLNLLKMFANTEQIKPFLIKSYWIDLNGQYASTRIVRDF